MNGYKFSQFVEKIPTFLSRCWIEEGVQVRAPTQDCWLPEKLVTQGEDNLATTLITDRDIGQHEFGTNHDPYLNQC